MSRGQLQWVQLICGGTDFFRKKYSTLGLGKKTCFRREYSMIKPRRTKYQWVDSKWVQLLHELRLRVNVKSVKNS